ncbi:DUF4290 domain-containing protein [Sphingobacteriales bacterium UPWRP_1]|nr:hypothetical protein BVG80_12295 [Sphingobacteriales bacterium TSM_CSM]PSJ71716.1 DUF4290 domain-containing protein [Sphingobacteriales bacterium UPWRP_1]
MENSNLNYNTQLDRILFKEYGRNVHKLVQHALTIEDRKERTAVAKAIVNLMALLHPNLKNIEEFKHKLWDQLHAIAGFKLDVDSPYPVPENYEQVLQKRAHVPYPSSKMKLRHYGLNIETLVQKTINTEHPRKRAELTRIIVYYMNLVHKSWNRESNMNDDIIKSDLKTLSAGQLDADWAEQYIIEHGGQKQVIQISINQNRPQPGSNQQQQGMGQRRKKKRGNRNKKNKQ